MLHNFMHVITGACKGQIFKDLEDNNIHKHFSFLQKGSKTGLAISTINWAETDLGSPENWPAALKFMLQYTLSAKVPMLLLWGNGHIQFYNDTFSPGLGHGNTLALGQKISDASPTLWQIIGATAQKVLDTGNAALQENITIPTSRDGYLNNLNWSLHYTPVTNENGNVQGVSITFNEAPAPSGKNNLAKEILQKEQALRSIIKSAPFPIGIYIGPKMVIEFANQALMDIWGRGKEVIGQEYQKVLPQLASQNVMAELTNVLQTGIPYKVSNRYLQIEKNGSLQDYYLNYSFTPLYDNSGTIYGIMSTAADVTGLNLAKQKVEQSQARFYSLIEEAPVATCLFTGRDMKIEVANPKMLELWGKDASVLGKVVSDGIPELKGQPFLGILDDVFTTGIAYSATDTYCCLEVNGILQPFYFDFTYKPLRNEKGEVYGIMDMAVDVTDKVLARQKTEQETARFHSLIKEAPVATALFTGREMTVEIVNEKMLKIWGKDSAIQGKPLAQAVPELTSQPFLDILDTVYTTGVAYEDTDTVATLAVDGILQTFYFDFTYKPLRNEKGEVYGIINMVVDVTNKVIANQRIIENQKQLLDSFEQSPVGIAMLNKEGLTFTMANAFYGELVGRKPQDIINMPLLEALPELAGQGFDDLLHSVISTGVAYVAKEVAAELLRYGHLETIYVDLAYQPMRDRDYTITGILVVATDVTQQVRSRKKVEASESRMRSVIASAPAGMGLFVGRDLIVEMPNQTFIDIVGKGWDIVGKPLREAMPELLAEGQPFLKILDDVFTTGIMYQTDGAQVKIVQNGVMTYNYYNITYTPLFDENNQVYAILDIAIDVTDAILARQRAEEAGAALRGAIELAELAAWSYNIKENTFNYSPRFMEWLGFSNSTKTADEAWNPLPQEYRQPVANAIKDAIQPGGNGLYKNEHPIINRLTGNEMIINAQAQVFYDVTGNPEVLSGTARDVTQERALQQQLENQVKERTEKLQYANAELADANSNLQKSNSELGQFAYIASHDLQEPVRKISTFIKMLEDNLGEKLDERSQFYIQRIENSTQRMTSLIRDILGYSQLSKDSEIFTATNLNEIARAVVTDFELVIEQKNATVSIGHLPQVVAIPLQMTQLFGNLISNSLKYSRNDVAPVITIEATIATDAEIADFHLAAGPNYYKITFKDNGIGFKQDYAHQIFNIFQRLHAKGEYWGTGIGLAMCKKIAQNHNGDIQAHAIEGEGAQFVVVLPTRHG